MTQQVAPVCSVYGRCGGCQYQHIPYEDELLLKESLLKELFAGKPGMSSVQFFPIVRSPREYGYRHRLDLKLTRWRDGQIFIGFSPVGKGPVIEVGSCPIAMEAVSSFIPQLRQEASSMLPPKYRMANLTVRCGDVGEPRWGGIGKRSLVLGKDEYLSVTIDQDKIFYSLDTFFQANLSILPVLRDVLRAFPIWSKDAVFFDLYGGVGLFSLMVRDLVKKVVDIEENVHAIRLAKHNMMYNRAANMDVFEGRVEEVLPMLLTSVTSSDNIVMVDPPRAGLSEDTIKLLGQIPRAKHLVYLSCDPQSFLENLNGLSTGGWRLKVVQPFDFFPRTRHLETLALFERLT